MSKEKIFLVTLNIFLQNINIKVSPDLNLNKISNILNLKKNIYITIAQFKV